jgi:hypothetical protein
LRKYQYVAAGSSLLVLGFVVFALLILAPGLRANHLRSISLFVAASFGISLGAFMLAEGIATSPDFRSVRNRTMTYRSRLHMPYFASTEGAVCSLAYRGHVEEGTVQYHRPLPLPLHEGRLPVDLPKVGEQTRRLFVLFSFIDGSESETNLSSYLDF